MKLTKAQKLGITIFPYKEYDEQGFISYHEFENGQYYEKRWNKKRTTSYITFQDGTLFIDKFDKQGNQIYSNSKGYWWKRRYDKNGQEIYYANSKGQWHKKRHNKYHMIISYEDYHGNYWNKSKMKGTINPYWRGITEWPYK